MEDKMRHFFGLGKGDEGNFLYPQRCRRPNFTKEEESALELFLSCLHKTAFIPSYLIPRSDLYSSSFIEAILNSEPRSLKKAAKIERILFFKVAFAIATLFLCPFTTITDKSFQDIVYFLETIDDSSKNTEILLGVLKYFRETKSCICSDQFSREALLGALSKMIRAVS